MRWLLAVILIGVVVVTFKNVALARQIQETEAKEAAIRAAYIYNFCLFVGWPVTTLKETDPIIIGVAGRNQFFDLVIEAARGKTVRGRQLDVRRVSSVAEARRTHVLFVGFTEENKIDEYLKALRDEPILTVGDSKAFSAKGGIVRFFRDEERVLFQINLEAAKDSRLTLAAKLLALSRSAPTP